MTTFLIISLLTIHAWNRTDCEKVAGAWLSASVRYDWTANTKQYVTTGKGLYRADCSGFVSACWDYAPPGQSTRDIKVDFISMSEMKRGDAFLHRIDGVGHIALFWDWEVKNEKPIVVEECGHMSSCCGNKATCPGACGSASNCNEYCPGCPIQKKNLGVCFFCV